MKTGCSPRGIQRELSFLILTTLNGKKSTFRTTGLLQGHLMKKKPDKPGNFHGEAKAGTVKHSPLLRVKKGKLSISCLTESWQIPKYILMESSQGSGTTDTTHFTSMPLNLCVSGRKTPLRCMRIPETTEAAGIPVQESIGK